MITPATLQDVSNLNKLINAAYRGDSARKGWTHEADYLGGIRTDEKQLTAMLQNPNATILKLEEENEIVGCVYLEKQNNKLYLGMLTVNPLLQAKGTGKQLLAASEDFGKQNSCTYIEMTVISYRKELIAYYERRGFELTGETKPFPMNDPTFGEPKEFLEFVVMRKEL